MLPTRWRAASLMIARGWGRIINVITKLDTMNRPTSSIYGASKAALEMATEIWAGNVTGTGVTINIVNPGLGANTPGMADEMKEASRAGTIDRLVEPEQMVPPLLWVISPAADKSNGYRFDADAWDPTLPTDEAARHAGRPAGFQLHPAGGPRNDEKPRKIETVHIRGRNGQVARLLITLLARSRNSACVNIILCLSECALIAAVTLRASSSDTRSQCCNQNDPVYEKLRMATPAIAIAPPPT